MISEFGMFRHDGCLFLEFWCRIPENDLHFVHDVRLMSCELTFSPVYGHVRISTWSCCIFSRSFVQIPSFSTDTLAFYEIQYGLHPQSLICWGSHETTHESPFMVAVPVKISS